MLTELAKYAKICRKHNIKRLKIDGLELELGEEPQKRPSSRKSKAEQQNNERSKEELMDELLLVNPAAYEAMLESGDMT